MLLSFCFVLVLRCALTGKLGRLTWVRHSSPRSNTTYSYQCVQYFRVSKQWYGCTCLGFLTCAQLLLHAIAHGILRECALEADSGRIIPCRTGDSNPRQYCDFLLAYFQSGSLPAELSPPHSFTSRGRNNDDEVMLNVLRCQLTY